jgi:hypothetical protein
VKHLGPRGLHTRALARSQHDDVEVRHGASRYRESS